jgi:cytidine deaminase
VLATPNGTNDAFNEPEAREIVVDQDLCDAAVELAAARYPAGWGGAAAMYTADGRILTSVYVETPNSGSELCMETGSICEAHKLGVAITASVCVSRESEDEPFLILSPCGICQERLAFWGGDVHVAVPHPDDPRKWQSKPLRKVQPYYWRKAFGPF